MVGEEAIIQSGAAAAVVIVSLAALKYMSAIMRKMQEVVDKNSEAMLQLAEAIATCPKKK